MGVTILVHCGRNLVIGKSGCALPARHRADLLAFRKRTMGHAVVVGRKTWDLMPRKPLPGRANVVISDMTRPGVTVEDGVGPYFCTSLKVAIQVLLHPAPRQPSAIPHHQDIFIIGGCSMFAQAVDQGIADRIIMSKAKVDMDGDLYFPKLGDEWVRSAIEYYADYEVSYLSRRKRD